MAIKKRRLGVQPSYKFTIFFFRLVTATQKAFQLRGLFVVAE